MGHTAKLLHWTLALLFCFDRQYIEQCLDRQRRRRQAKRLAKEMTMLDNSTLRRDNSRFVGNTEVIRLARVNLA